MNPRETRTRERGSERRGRRRRGEVEKSGVRDVRIRVLRNPERRFIFARWDVRRRYAPIACGDVRSINSLCRSKEEPRSNDWRRPCSLVLSVGAPFKYE